MTVLDLWAALAAAAAGSAIAVRARMLRPRQRAWTAAPAPVWIGLSGLALSLLMTAVAIAGGAHATATEAMVYTVLAAVSVVMLWNLDRHGRQACVERERIRREVDQVLELTPQPARYSGERSR